MKHDSKTQTACDEDGPCDAATDLDRLSPMREDCASAKRWLADNAEALASSNLFVEASGLPLARHRQF
jgi:hypothetical protein